MFSRTAEGRIVLEDGENDAIGPSEACLCNVLTTSSANSNLKCVVFLIHEVCVEGRGKRQTADTDEISAGVGKSHVNSNSSNNHNNHNFTNDKEEEEEEEEDNKQQPQQQAMKATATAQRQQRQRQPQRQHRQQSRTGVIPSDVVCCDPSTQDGLIELQ